MNCTDKSECLQPLDEIEAEDHEVTKDELLEAALAYGDRGIRIFPLYGFAKGTLHLW